MLSASDSTMLVSKWTVMKNWIEVLFYLSDCKSKCNNKFTFTVCCTKSGFKCSLHAFQKWQMHWLEDN